MPQVGKGRKNAHPDGWFPPRGLYKEKPGGSSASRASGADPLKHPKRLGRIIRALLKKKLI